MRALTVQQPWAWAIVHGGKDVENRTQAWSYRGPLAIHAGARVSDRGMNDPRIGQALRDRGHVSLPPVFPGGRVGDLWGAPVHRSAFIGIVDLVDVHHHAGSGDRNDCCDSPWAESYYPGAGSLVHLVLENPRPLEHPVPCKGRLGLWTPPAEVLDELQEAL